MHQPLEQLREAFRSKPDDARIFESLEEHYFLNGCWRDLAGLYQERIDAESIQCNATERARLHFRLAQLLEDRCREPDAAVEHYWAVARADASFRPALWHLRRLHAARGQWDLVLQIAELEESTSMKPAERGAFLADIGEVWLDRLDEKTRGLGCFERALEADPDLDRARAGAARALEALARPADAVAHWERLVGQRSGPRRAEALLALARLHSGPLRQPERAEALLKRAISDDPRSREAFEALARVAAACQHWEVLEELFEPRFERAERPRDQLEIALEAGRIHLERLDQPERAREWLERALALAPKRIEVHDALVEVARRIADPEALLAASERRIAADPEGVPASALLEAAELQSEAGDEARALDLLERARKRAPDNPLVLDALSDALLRLDRFDALTEILEQRAELAGDDTESRAATLTELGRIWEKDLGEPLAAAGCYQRALDAEPELEAVAAQLEQLLRGTGNWQALRGFLERESERGGEPRRLQARCALGELLLEQIRDPAAAGRAFEAGLDLDPSAQRALRGLCRSALASGDNLALVGALARGVETCSEAARLADFTAQLQRLDRSGVETAAAAAARAGERLEDALAAAADWPGLRARLEACLEAAPEADRPALHLRLAALCRDRLSDAEGCVAHLESAGRIDPSRAEIWQQLAACFEAPDRVADRVRVLEAELETEPEAEREVALRARSGAAHAELGDDDRAGDHYRRALELAPEHPEALEFLIEHHARHGQPEASAELLERRLAAVAADDPDSSLVTSLRLRLARLRDASLDDAEGAIAALLPELAPRGNLAAVTEVLFGLFQRTGRVAERALLCDRAAQQAATTDATAQWRLRLAEAWRERGEREDLERAEAIFLEAASQFAADAELRCALRDIYRRLERPQALADQIELELAAEPAALSDADARALRLEWSELLADALDAPARALEELLQILAEVPDHAQAEARALTLAERLDRAAIRLKLLDARLAHTRAEPQRASLQLERGALLVGPLERPEEAVLAYREAASLEPDPGEARLALRGALAALERWPELLEDLWAEAQTASAEARPRLLEEAEHTARAKLPPDLRVGWLERLRGARPGDAALLAEIADLHRGAGRSTPLLRSLEAQIALDPTGPKAGPLHLERAQILENALGSNARAIEALEAARSLDADDPAVLARLDRLYEREGRLRERARILEERIRISDGDPPEARIALHRHAAQVWRGVQMPEPELAQRLRAVAAAASAAPAERAVLLRELAESLQRAGRPDLWVRAGEAELRCLGADEAPRRLVLQLALAARYARDGRRPREALAHLQDFFAIAERLRDTPDAAQAEAFEWAEAVRLELLRRDRNFLALADCLERWLATRREDAGGWLELARIREEQLADPAGALAAFREALQLRPADDAALRGLRRTAERLGDWREVVRTLEIALQQANPEPPQARAALLRQLGRLCDERIDGPDRAIEAYSRALEIDASDLVSLRALQSLRARCDDRDAELELSQREIEVLAEAEPERRRALWLRVAELSRDQSGDPARAQRAFEQAARCGALDADQLRTWASLCEQSGDRERQAEVFAAWCDDASTVATGADHRAVAELLEELGRPEEALARAQRALQISDRDPASWDTTARLHEAVGEPASAADALECAAQLLGGSQAEQRLRRAGKLAEASDLERAECLYRRAAECDPASVAACAQLATTAARRSRWDLAEDAAGRALDLAEAGAGSDPSAPRELMLAAALAGGRAARARDRLEPAARFFTAAAAIDAASPEALDGLGDSLHALGDAPGAASAFAKRLDLARENPRRAHQQAVVALGRVLGGDPEAALGQFCAALELDPTEPIANAGIVDLHQRAGRVRDAVAALDHWISVCESDPERASLERRAADLELEAGDLEGAERHLRGALRWQPADLGAARPLADLLWNAERAEEALAVATGAIAAGSPGPDRSRLELIRARALEVTHDAPAAAEAFARAFEADPRCAEAAVSCGRLLRSLGRWRDAAAALGAFTDRHPEPDLADLAAIFTERGRLLAGPLEDLQAAVACYERAIALDPGATAPREQLARILSLLPVRRREAVGHHAQLLRADPTSGASLRALSRISAEGGQDGTRARGLALLRTLGLASPEERSEIPSDLALRADAVARLEPALWETLRNAFSEAREALAASLAPPPEPAPRQSLDSPIEAFRRAQRRNFGRLCAEALWGRSGDELNAAARALHDVAFGEKREDLAGRLEAALGSRGRRRLRRALTGVSYSQILDLDFDAWRQALEQMAAAAALSECGGDLRSALLALSAADDRRPDDRAGTNADICARISGSESARALLEAAVRTWCSEVGEAGR